MKIKHYMDDGANWQAQAVLACLKCIGDIEESWSKEYHRYIAEINVARWENCREQGYVLSLRCPNAQLNIAFFEHRNSDSICAVKWEQFTINAPTIDTAEFCEVYEDKWSVSCEVKPGQFEEMAKWIMEQFTAFWIKNNKELESQNSNVNRPPDSL